MAHIVKSLILGIIEGVTEWLPISSTGHLMLAEKLIPLGFTPEFNELFDVVIQLGAIMAVVVIYWSKLWPFTTKQNGYIKMPSISLWLKVIVGTLPSIIIGFILKKTGAYAWLRDSSRSHYIIAGTLIFYGILFIIIEAACKNHTPKIRFMNEFSYKTALLVGLFQTLAFVPGTSRSGATIIGALILSTSRVVAAEYSFFLALPAMLGAAFLEILDYVETVPSAGGFSSQALPLVCLITATLTAFIVSMLAIKFFIGYIKKRSFTAFGIYRIALGIVVLLIYAHI